MGAEKIRSLQALRFVAAAMVVAVHAIFFVRQLLPGPDFTNAYTGIGASGVDIFFVISGFVIYRSARKRPSAISFFRKRLLRVAPIYSVATIAMFPICAFFGWLPDAASIATSVTFWPAWGHIVSPVDPVGWSLCFEMLFYTAAAITLLSRRAFAPIMIAYGAAWLARTQFAWPAFEFIGNPIILEFLFGAVIAAFWNPERVRPLSFGFGLLLLGFTGLYVFCLPTGQESAAFVLDGTQSFRRVVSWGLPACLIVYGALNIEPHLRGAWIRRATYLGDASYSIYLSHWPLFAVIGGLVRLSGAPHMQWLGWILFALGIGGGIATYKFVEIPLTAALGRRVA